MNVRELRRKYIEFFLTKGHEQFPSGSLVPYDVTGKLDESLLFNGAGMVQFKPYFRGVATPPAKRLTNAQKCVRTGDIESVGDLSHLTFFEMMGNFSFGDYFKREAIAFSWEFLTSPNWLGLDPQRLSFTVFEEDDEAYHCWAHHLEIEGIDPASRIFRLGEETNYWPAGAFSSGPPGPCGPNSEMFYWVSKAPPPPSGKWTGKGSAYTREDWIKDDAAQNWLEIWNDVFIQYEWKGKLKDASKPNLGYEKQALDPLPFQSVDTGMGLERTAAVLGGFASVYDTDAFTPILRAIETVPSSEIVAYGANSDRDTAIRIIADHIRTAVFCIADGILPSNTGRGYVLRRLIRRAVLKGQRALGFENLFLYRVYDGVVEALGDHYHELTERRDVIVETLKNEEDLFRRTLARGIQVFHQVRESLDAVHFPGERAFDLYDTYGFPLEVTQELAAEAGLEIDLEGYEKALTEAQERSRGSSEMEAVYTTDDRLVVSADYAVPSRFVGYDHLEWDADIVRVNPMFDSKEETTGEFLIALDQTPFYAESGGQVGDAGILEGQKLRFEVSNTKKEAGTFWHAVKRVPGDDWIGVSRDDAKIRLEAGEFFVPVRAKVDGARRRRITRNHSATHLLHFALRSVLGKHVTQAGSLVHPDYLRFDFTHGKAMTPNELAQVERIVNDLALQGEPIEIKQDVPIQEAKALGAMALFGEKYGDAVRVVRMGESIELCGGCHVRATSEIGMFKITSESSAASGIRRIEAVTGEGAYQWAVSQAETVRQVADVLKSSPAEVLAAATKTAEALRDERKRVEKLRSQTATEAGQEVQRFGEVEFVQTTLHEGEPKDATLVADRLSEGQSNRVVFVTLETAGKLTFVCKVGSTAQGLGAHAGNLVKAAATAAGGGGGGRADFATAGGKDVSKLGAAQAAATGELRTQLKV